jgi:hypothetical protein
MGRAGTQPPHEGTFVGPTTQSKSTGATAAMMSAASHATL